jgi:hypothetical protein
VNGPEFQGLERDRWGRSHNLHIAAQLSLHALLSSGLTTAISNLVLPPEERAASTKIFNALKALHGDVTQQQPLNPKDRQAALKDLAENVTAMLASGNRDAKILLPVLAEATRETLGSPRGKRSGGPDRPSFAMTQGSEMRSGAMSISKGVGDNGAM